MSPLVHWHIKCRTSIQLIYVQLSPSVGYYIVNYELSSFNKAF